jgi:hypothetical protein
MEVRIFFGSKAEYRRALRERYPVVSSRSQESAAGAGEKYDGVRAIGLVASRGTG